MIENTQLVYNVLKQKCSYKKINVPTFESIKNHEKLEELDGEIFQPNRIASAYSINSVIHKIQFAAANRVCMSGYLLKSTHYTPYSAVKS